MSDAGVLMLENGIPASVRQELERRGHRLDKGAGGYGGYQALLRNPETGVYHAASEMRKDGLALGY